MLKYRLISSIFFLIIVSNVLQATDWDLSQVMLVEANGSSFTIAYPSNWHTSGTNDSAVISELESDHSRALGDAFTVQGYQITFERFRPRALARMGIRLQEFSLEEDLAAFANAEGYASEQVISETLLLAWPALQVRTIDALGNHLISIIALHNHGTELARLRLLAPSAEALDLFLPTWDEMLASIQINEGSVRLADYSLGFACFGEGTPTIIFEKQWTANDSYLDFYLDLYQGRPDRYSTSNRPRTCYVERHLELGLGAAQQYSEDLHQALTIANIPAPYILVGHSYGSIIVRIFADEYPDEVLGIVLVDALHQDIYNHMQNALYFVILKDPNIDRDAMTEITYDQTAPYPEISASLSLLAETASLGDKPLLVLSAERFYDDLTLHPEDEFRPLWNELQADLVTLSTQGQQMVLADTSHLSIIWTTTTSELILEFVDLVRNEQAQ